MAQTSFAPKTTIKSAEMNQNFLEKAERTYRTQATAAGTTTLVYTDAYQQFFTGTTTQTVTLPVASTMPILGAGFELINNSTGIVTVNSSGANLVQTMQPGSSVFLICILLSGTSAASWQVMYSPSNTGPLYITKAGSYGLLATGDNFVSVSAAATITLPTAVGLGGKQYTINNISAADVNVTIATTSAQTIGARVSSDIILTKLNDFIVVVSDGANWQILAKRETTSVSTTTGSYDLTSLGGSARYALMTTNSLVLGVGVWRVYGYGTLFTGTAGAGVYLSANGGASGFYAANGANSAAAPTAISATVQGSIAYVSDGTGLQVMGGGAGLACASSTLQFDIFCTASTTIYFVPFLQYTTVSNSAIKLHARAVRIW